MGFGYNILKPNGRKEGDEYMLFLHYENITAQTAYQILFQRRKGLRMTQQQVADKAGVQLRQYQRLESGEREISSASGNIMLPICKALMLDPYLFVGDGNDRPETCQRPFQRIDGKIRKRLRPKQSLLLSALL